MNNSFTKVSDNLARDVKTGRLTANEYLVLVYMLQNADKRTGIINTNSRLLSIELNIGRVRIRDILTSLKRKNRLQTPDGDSTDNLQKRGSTRPYSILLCDALPIGNYDRDSTETRQRLDGGTDRGTDRGTNGETSQRGKNTNSSSDSEEKEAATDKTRKKIKNNNLNNNMDRALLYKAENEEDDVVVLSEDFSFYFSEKALMPPAAAVGGMVNTVYRLCQERHIELPEAKIGEIIRKLIKDCHEKTSVPGGHYVSGQINYMNEQAAENKVQHPIKYLRSACNENYAGVGTVEWLEWNRDWI